MSKQLPKSRRYVFTINNYTKKELKQFHILAESLEKHRYISYGLETAPTTGTKHIQGYIEMNSAVRYSAVQKYVNIIRKKALLKFHVEIAKGTADECKKYNSKDGEHFEFGEPKKQGARTDLVEVREHLKKNPRDLKRMVLEDIAGYQAMKYAENLQKYIFTDRDLNNPPKVFWIYGSSGSGKTRLAYDTFEDICSVSDFGWLGTGYTQNECFLLDDFRPGLLNFDYMLRVTDRYPLSLPVKGGQVQLNSPFIIITSPYSIDRTFLHSGEDLTQLKRRATEIDLDEAREKGTLQSIDLRDYTEEDPDLLDLDGIDF